MSFWHAAFLVSNALILPMWAGMIFAPGARWTRQLVGSRWSVIAPAALYFALMAPRLPTYFLAFLWPEVDNMGRLLAETEGTVRVYTYFLASDYFIGRWMFFDARRRGVPQTVLGPLLFVTLLLGPIGWLPYYLWRTQSDSDGLTDG